MKKLKNDIINLILIVFAFAFNIAFFAPIEIFYTNKQDLWFNLKDVLLISIPFAIITFAILLVIGLLLKGKARRIYTRIIFTLFFLLYIQGNYLNYGYGTKDGAKIVWDAMLIKGLINTIIWILIIVLPYCIKPFRKYSNFKMISSILSILIIIVQSITLATLAITNNTKKYVLSNKNINTFSQDNNIIVIMSDTFEGTFMNDILQKNPEYKEKLKDFTYFDNCTGVSFFTFSSMPTLLTGVQGRVGYDLKDNVEYCFNNSYLYDELKKNGYNTEIYVESGLVPNYDGIDNLENRVIKTNLKTKTEIAQKMYKYSLFKYLPHFLKPKFEMENTEFEDLKVSTEVAYEDDTYYLNDVEFNKNLIANGIRNTNSKKAFKFFEFSGMHTPYNTKPEIEFDNSINYKKTNENQRRYNEGLASLNLLCNYVDKLKEAGVYDSTNIIFLADHGYYNRFYTALLVKKANESHNFEINSAPVTTLEDLVPTILNMSKNTKEYGKDFFDYAENEERTRHVLDYTYDTKAFNGNTYKILSKMIFETKGNAKNKNEFYIIGEEFENENKKLKGKYKFGELIKVENIYDLDYVNLTGFTINTAGGYIPNGANIGKEASLTIKTNKAKNNVTAKFVLDRLYDSNQIINFKIDGETIHTSDLSENKEYNIICFEIPKEKWNKNKEVKIDIEFPNAKMGILHATTMTVIRLKSIVFETK